ncbi:MAG: polysaccharide deacetylase family protein [Acidobacteria bacterium]|nr:polysaccharide deacetylase family protein [Acidobacteriota bacterium]
MQRTKPIASLSLDLDNQWSYMKTHGDAGWESFPSYLDIVVPRVLSFLKQIQQPITFFIVGQDAALEKNAQALASLAEAGHEIGNHSFHHEPWLHLYTEQQIEEEIAQAEEQIERVTGKRTTGFRGPGFSCSEPLLRVLKRRGYEYDCSTFPTYLGPLARAYYFATAKLTPEEREKRKALFGKFSEGLRPLKPYQWQLAEGELIEIPVTTLPVFKTPIHISYLLYASSYSPALAKLYFRTALTMCKLAGVQPSILLHPLDFLGCDDVKELAFFPGMQMTGKRKVSIVHEMLAMLRSEFAVVPMKQHAEAIKKSELMLVSPASLTYDKQFAN